MEKVLSFVRNRKVIIIIAIILIIAIIIIGNIISQNKKKEYNLIEVSEFKYFILNIDNKYGVIDTKGNVLIEPIYNNVIIPNPEKTVFICNNSERNIVLNDKNQNLFEKYDEVSPIDINGIVSNIPYEKTVLKYKENGKFGLISFEGTKITNPIYDEILGLKNKETEMLVKKDGKCGVINAKGATLIREEYDDIVADAFYKESEKYGLSGYIVSNKTMDGYRYGYIDYKHKKILEVEYNSIERILQNDSNDICLIACKNGQYGIIKNNDVFINYSYQGIEYDNDNKLFELRRNGKLGIIDYNGNQIVPVEYNEIVRNGMYIKAVKSEEKSDIYDTSGNKITNFEYTSLMKTQNNNYYISIDENDLYGIINNNNEEIIKNKYSYIEYLFQDYFIAAKENGYLGVIDSKDKIVVDFKYHVLQRIDGTNVLEAKILTQDITDLYSIELKNIYSAKNTDIYEENGYIKAYTISQTRYFDLDGNEIKNDKVFINNSLLASKLNNKWGFVDRNGNVVVNYDYDKVTEFNKYGFAGIMKDNKWGVIDEKGNIVIEPTYTIEESNEDPEFIGKYYRVYYGYGESYFTN